MSPVATILRLAYLVLATAAARAVVAQILPPSAARRSRLVFAACGAVALAAWLVPLAGGHGMYGTVPVVGIPLRWFGNAWLVLCTLVWTAGLPLAAADRLLAHRRPDAPPESPSRRRALVLAGRALPVLGVAATAAGTAASFPVRLRRETISIGRLPAGLDGFRIGFLSDAHLGPVTPPERLRRAVSELDDAGIHLLAFGGDLADDRGLVDEAFAALDSTRAVYGAVACAGNHEHHFGLDLFRRAAARSGVRFPVDASFVLRRGGAELRVVGADYPVTRGSEDREAAMERSAARAFRDVRPGETVLCLSHHPEFVDFAAPRGVALMLAGHYHGGQVALAGVPLLSPLWKHVRGRYVEGSTHLYVTTGVGHWMPFRVGTPCEAVVVELRAA